MSDRRVTSLECDQCGREAIVRISRRKTRRIARLAGWDIGRGRLADLCPSCAAAPAVPGATTQ